VKVCLFQNSPIFLLDCDEEEENTPEETQQPLTSRGPEFFPEYNLRIITEDHAGGAF